MNSMKNVMIWAVLTMNSFSSFSQWVDGDTIPNFVMNDLKGDEYNLYNILGEGKPVLLDFFFPACSPCWGGMVHHEVKDVAAFYGKNGSNQMDIIGVNIWGKYMGLWNWNSNG